MSKIGSGNPHNNYFIKNLSDIDLAKDFFMSYLPESIRDLVDWNNFKLALSDFIDKALKNRKSDILYQTQIKDKKVYFHILLEH